MHNAQSVSVPLVNGGQALSATVTDQKRRVALVVEADYFALTSRIDKAVIFWSAGFARKGVPQIPQRVTDLWVAPHVSGSTAQHLRAQAHSRGIKVWDNGLNRPVAIGELIRRLLPFWVEPTNRSMIRPVVEGSNIEELQLALDRAVVPVLDPAERARRVAESRIKADRMEDLRRANRKVLRGGKEEEVIESVPRMVRRAKVVTKALPAFEPVTMVVESTIGEALEAPAPPATRESIEPLVAALKKLSSLERFVFTAYYGLEDSAQTGLESTAKEFGLSVAKVTAIVARVWAKLPQLGFNHDEAWLSKVL